MLRRFFLKICSAQGCRSALLGTILLLFAGGARADIYDITFINVTFSAPCIRTTATCTETINGSGLYDAVARTATGISISLTGTLNASLDGFGAPACGVPGCLKPPVLYDMGVLPGYNPIEFSPSLPTFDAPTPESLSGGVNGSLLFVAHFCGGDQPACNTTGAFPGGTADYTMASGTYTSVDLGPSPTPEPGSVILVVTGLAVLGCSKFDRRKSSRI